MSAPWVDMKLRSVAAVLVTLKRAASIALPDDSGEMAIIVAGVDGHKSSLTQAWARLAHAMIGPSLGRPYVLRNRLGHLEFMSMFILDPLI